MHDIGGLIWIVLVIIGVVTSISRSARRSVAQRTVTTYHTVPAPQRLAPAAEVRPEVVAELENIIRQSQATPRPAPAPAAPPKPPPAANLPPPPVRTMVSVPARPSRAEKLFGDRSSVVRAVIAAEVLGKPLALRNEYSRY
jgi:hypothetical protein